MVNFKRAIEVLEEAGFSRDDIKQLSLGAFTQRDDLAKAAMQGLLANTRLRDNAEVAVASAAYRQADAMIKASREV